ncbi:hypothetical protein OG401_19405 [Kitasatospora purpeofusca]|uniref:hypothetical protein n=1 Tax=Kitasatospora TaxID=2063 RepID=UPI002257E3A6|nr:hypothetical protein [Kitasatospora purpeofusca]MCX4686450.1 hypothetical protein [Kitasatospora purpeofusca]
MADRQDGQQATSGGPVEDLGRVDPFEWLHAHPWPPERSADPPPVLTPEEFSETPLTPEDRDRRADLLARLREANHPWR